MKIIETIFKLHDEAGSVALPSIKERFGSLWRPEEGIILYPPNGNARDYVTLLKITVPEIPLIVCDESKSEAITLNGLEVYTVAEATRILPHALFVLCATGDRASEMFSGVAQELSLMHINNIITFRQLGEFLPVGNTKTKAFDVFRKTFLAASPRNRKKVEAAFALFEDTLSQAVFCAVLKRYMLCSDTLMPVSVSQEYFEDVYTPRPDEVFVDCGAYSGDTLMKLLELRGGG
jgi:hypothetical protein